MGCVGAAPSELDRNGLERRQIVPEPQRLGRGHGKGEGLRGHAGMVHEPVRQVHGNSAKQVLQRLHDCFDFRLVRAGVQRLPPRAAVQQLVEDLDLLLQQGERLVDRRPDLLAGAVPVGVVGQRHPQRLRDADVVDDQSTRARHGTYG